MLKTICLYGFFPHIRSNINFSVCKIRKARGIFRLQTSDFRLQTLDVLFHSFYFGLHTSALSAIVI